MKERIITQPHSQQMNSQLRKAMYSKRMSQNMHWCDKNDDKLFEDFKRKRNFFVNLSHTSVSNYFKERYSFMSSKGENHNEIMLCEDDVIITEPEKVGEVFNDYFIKVTEDIGIRENINGSTISDILDMYTDHHSVLKIANNHDGQLFTLKTVSVQEMEKNDITCQST